MRETLDTKEKILLHVISSKIRDKMYDESNLFYMWIKTDLIDDDFKKNFLKARNDLSVLFRKLIEELN